MYMYIVLLKIKGTCINLSISWYVHKSQIHIH